MKLFSFFFCLSAVFFLAVVSSTPEAFQTKRKRVCFDETEYFEEEIDQLTDTIDGVSVSDGLLSISDRMLPSLSEHDLVTMFDESIMQLEIGLIKIFHRHGELERLLDEDYLDFIFRSPAPESVEIIEFILENVQIPEDYPVFDMLLYLCTEFRDVKFSLFWNSLDTESILSTSEYARLAISASCRGEDDPIYLQVLERKCQGDEAAIKRFHIAALKEAIGMTSQYEAVEFFVQLGASLSELNVYERVRALTLAAQHDDFELTEALLEEVSDTLSAELMRLRIRPWSIAVRNDFSDVFSVYLDKLYVLVSSTSVLIDAITRRSERILRLMRDRGLLTDSIGFQMASSYIESNDLDRFDTIINFGLSDLEMTNEEGFTLLCMAVRKNSSEIASYLLDAARVNPDMAIHCPLSNGRVGHFTALIFANSVEMARILLVHGAYVDYLNFETVSETGDVFRRYTKLQKALSEADHDMAHILEHFGAKVTQT